MIMESQISTLKEDLEREQKKWRTAQDNYERQVPFLPLRSRLYVIYLLMKIFVGLTFDTFVSLCQWSYIKLVVARNY